ncbi:hypothetical protein GCM10027217_31300 [Pseudomaricurvus hydrocarbonicus]
MLLCRLTFEMFVTIEANKYYGDEEYQSEKHSVDLMGQWNNVWAL